MALRSHPSPPQRSCCSSYRCATRGTCSSVSARRPWSTNQSNTSPWLVRRGPAAWAASLAVELTWSGRARRCRYRSNLLEQPHQVEVVPRLGDIVTPDLDHLDRLDYNALSSRRDGAERSSQFARVSAIPRDLEDCIVATAERLGDRSGRVGERALPVLGRFDGVVDSKAPLRRQLLVRRVGREGRFEPAPISSVVRVDVFPRNRKRICHTPYLHARSPGIPPSVTASGRTASMVRRYSALQPIAFGARYVCTARSDSSSPSRSVGTVSALKSASSANQTAGSVRGGVEGDSVSGPRSSWLVVGGASSGARHATKSPEMTRPSKSAVGMNSAAHTPVMTPATTSVTTQIAKPPIGMAQTHSLRPPRSMCRRRSRRRKRSETRFETVPV